MNPEDADAYHERGESLIAAGRMAEAEPALLRALELEPGYWSRYTSLGNFHYGNQEFVAALPYYETVTEMTPDSASAFNNLAIAHYMLNDYEHAAEAWERSLQLRPNRSAYTNTGLSYYYLGRFLDAAEMQMKAIELTPEDHCVWGRLAESYRFVPGMEIDTQEAYQNAIEFAERSLVVNSKDWRLIALLALYCSHAAHVNKAKDYLQRALALAGSEPDMHYFAALVTLQLDDEKSTYVHLRQALALGFKPRLIREDPDLAALMGNEEFVSLLSNANP